MSVFVKWLIVAVESYLLGSVSFAIIISKRFYGKDIRTFGSGNAGMTNMLRTFGKKAAGVTIAGDALKGTLAVIIARLMFDCWSVYTPGSADSIVIFGRELFLSSQLYGEIAIYIAVAGSLLGHLYPLYFGFKGGKGISVIAGSMIAATPIPLLLALGVFFLVAFTSKIVSLASITACMSYLFITLGYSFVTQNISIPNLIAAVVFPYAIIWAHRENIKRLLNGTEYKFGQNKK